MVLQLLSSSSSTGTSRPTTWLWPVWQAVDQSGRTSTGPANWTNYHLHGCVLSSRHLTSVRLAYAGPDKLGVWLWSRYPSSAIQWSGQLVSALIPIEPSEDISRGWRSHSQLWIPGAGKYRAVLVKCDLKIGGTVGRSAPKSRQDVLWRHIGCWTWFGRYPWIPQGLKHNTVQAWNYWMLWSGHHRFINTCWFTLNDLIGSENRTYLHNKVISLCSLLVW